MIPVAARPAAVQAAVPHHFTAISLAAAGICIVFALMLKWKPLKKLEFLTPWLFLLAGVGFAAAFLTSWANTAMQWAASIPYVGGAIPIAVAFVLGYIVVYDLWPRHESNKVTEYSALLLPAVGPQIGGTVGSILTTFISTTAVTGAAVLGKLFGV